VPYILERLWFLLEFNTHTQKPTDVYNMYYIWIKGFVCASKTCRKIIMFYNKRLFDVLCAYKSVDVVKLYKYDSRFIKTSMSLMFRGVFGVNWDAPSEKEMFASKQIFYSISPIIFNGVLFFDITLYESRGRRTFKQTNKLPIRQAESSFDEPNLKKVRIKSKCNPKTNSTLVVTIDEKDRDQTYEGATIKNIIMRMFRSVTTFQFD
jgi:hypothetical protein